MRVGNDDLEYFAPSARKVRGGVKQGVGRAGTPLVEDFADSLPRRADRPGVVLVLSGVLRHGLPVVVVPVVAPLPGAARLLTHVGTPPQVTQFPTDFL